MCCSTCNTVLSGGSRSPKPRPLPRLDGPSIWMATAAATQNATITQRPLVTSTRYTEPRPRTAAIGRPFSHRLVERYSDTITSVRG